MTDRPVGHRHVALLVRMPDRPGALGAVASRIGAVGANITHVDILGGRRRRDMGPLALTWSAVDEFHVDLPDPANASIDLLRRELGEVDGTEIIEIRDLDSCELCSDH